MHFTLYSDFCRFDLFRMQSWRKTEPTLLCPVMKQKKSTCYAIALEFHLKLKKKMPLDQHLSIQDFINLIPKGYLNAEDGSLMVDAFHVLSIFEKNGILLEKDCQLTESLVDVVCEDKVSHLNKLVLHFFLHSFNFYTLLTCYILEELSQVPCKVSEIAQVESGRKGQCYHTGIPYLS